MEQSSVYAGTVGAYARPAIRGMMIISRIAGHPDGLILKKLTAYKEEYLKFQANNWAFKALISGGCSGQLDCFIIKDPDFGWRADYCLIVPDGIAVPFVAPNKPWGCQLKAGQYFLHDLGSHWGVRLPVQSSNFIAEPSQKV